MKATSKSNLSIAEKRRLVLEGRLNKSSVGVNELRTLADDFRAFFSAKGYLIEKPVDITSNVDPTVRFVGAPISVLKPYFLEKKIPGKGICMTQNCIRTQNAKHLFNLEHTPKYGSFFTGLCVLTTYDRLKLLCHETITFLLEELGLKKTDLRINISSNDRDLIQAAEGCLPKKSFYYDTKASGYYRHKYGEKDVWGRNFNIAVRSPLDSEYDDIGNIIVIESEKGKLGVELALGDTTITKQLFGLSHVYDAYVLNVLDEHHNEALKRKFEDSIITCIALVREGLSPARSTTQARILRTYAKSLFLYRHLSKVSAEELKHFLKTSEEMKLPFESREAWKDIYEWVQNYESKLGLVEPNKDDRTILDALKGAGYNTA